MRGHFGPINAVVFSPDGTQFVSGGEEGYIRLHTFDAGEPGRYKEGSGRGCGLARWWLRSTKDAAADCRVLIHLLPDYFTLRL